MDNATAQMVIDVIQCIAIIAVGIGAMARR